MSEKGYRIFTVERTILEGLKFIKKIGERTDLKAARDRLTKRQATELKLGKVAKELGLESTQTKYLEVILLSQQNPKVVKIQDGNRVFLKYSIISI